MAAPIGDAIGAKVIFHVASLGYALPRNQDDPASYAELTGPSGTTQAKPHPLGGRHTLIVGVAVVHSVSSFPHSGHG